MMVKQRATRRLCFVIALKAADRRSSSASRFYKSNRREIRSAFWHFLRQKTSAFSFPYNTAASDQLMLHKLAN
ncbi:hypothetical protein ACNR9V_14850 [Parageobacillus thermoglucosidasius]|uniref:hypothetical protein n=1 Tax=Parageobacillus thermoglucosidasius TaxID=1426 RepID=UPI003B67F734